MIYIFELIVAISLVDLQQKKLILKLTEQSLPNLILGHDTLHEKGHESDVITNHNSNETANYKSNSVFGETAGRSRVVVSAYSSFDRYLGIPLEISIILF